MEMSVILYLYYCELLVKGNEEFLLSTCGGIRRQRIAFSVVTADKTLNCMDYYMSKPTCGQNEVQSSTSAVC